jgi:hypothetical protein
MIFIRKRYRLCRPDDGGDGLASTIGGAADVGTVDGAAAAPVAAPAPAAEGPKTMAEAMWGDAPTPAPAADSQGQPRDDQGRFTFKNAQGQAVDASGVPAPDQVAALAAQAAAAPAVAEDPTKMPEGLGPKAQERFQTLANSNKELTAKVTQFETEIMPAVQAMQETWRANQVQPEQFEQAMSVVGMMNRGDYAGAQRVLMEQLQHLSVLTGQSAQIDPISGHPDLQQQVQQLMMTPEAAAEVARARATQSMTQQAQQRQQQADEAQRQQREAAQQSQQVRATAQADVNTFCKQMQGTDLDYAAIEAQLLPVIPQLLQNVQPEHWAAVVKQQYQLIKQATSTARRTPTAPAFQPLRATGQGGGTPQPKSMYDAMWGGAAKA